MIGLNPLQARLLMPVRRVAHSSSRGLARRAMSGGAAAGTATSGPSTAASAVMLSIPVLTFGLGTWQIARKKQKEELIAHMNAKLVQAAKPLPTSPADVRGMEYERVKVEGQFLHDQEMIVAPRTKLREMFSGGMSDRPDPGAHVVTPFRRTDGSTILVNRGFVPDNLRSAEARREGQVQGTVAIEGIVRNGESGNSFTPPNKPEKNEWHWFDLKAMAQHAETQPVLIDVVAESTPASGYPLGGQTRLTIRNEHLQYIITWYSLSAATFLMWLKFRKPSVKVDTRRLPPRG